MGAGGQATRESQRYVPGARAHCGNCAHASRTVRVIWVGAPAVAVVGILIVSGGLDGEACVPETKTHGSAGGEVVGDNIPLPVLETLSPPAAAAAAPPARSPGNRARVARAE